MYIQIVTAVPTVKTSADLSKDTPPVDPKLITTPYSANYTIGVWHICINFNSTIQQFLTYGDKRIKQSLDYL
jgi:hypothetical protein